MQVLDYTHPYANPHTLPRTTPTGYDEVSI